MIHHQAPAVVRGGVATHLTHQGPEAVLLARRHGVSESGIQFIAATKRHRGVRLVHAQGRLALTASDLAEHLHRLLVMNEDITRIGRGFSNNLHVFYLTGDSENAPAERFSPVQKRQLTPSMRNPQTLRLKELWCGTPHCRAEHIDTA